jgi:hypothetical protein
MASSRDQDLRHDLQRLARDVAGHLGSTWTSRPDPNGWGGMLLVEGGGDDAAAVHLQCSQGRLHCNGRYPTDRERPYHFDRPEITVAIGRPPVQIASEISRRLLPPYRIDLARVIAYDTEQRRFHEARQAVTRRLAAILPGARVSVERRSGYGEVSWWSDDKSPAGRVHRLGLKVDHQGREVTDLELSSVSLEVAEQILRLIVQEDR